MPDIAIVAGSTAAAVFLIAQLPMLIKAHRTRDLASYSAANIVLANLGNTLYTIYLINIPLGPAWAVHAFNMTTSGLMLIWYLQHHRPASNNDRPVRQTKPAVGPTTADAAR